MDENSKNQSKISKLVEAGAIKITAKNKDMLSPNQLKRYEAARKEQNIVYFKPKGTGGRFYEFDSETKAPVRKPPMVSGLGRTNGSREERIAEVAQEYRSKANKYKRNPKSESDSSPSGKAYSTELGISLPRRRPAPVATAEQMRALENIKKTKGSSDYRKGGMVLSTVDNRKNK